MTRCSRATATKRSDWSSCCPYTLDLESDGNQRFVNGMLKNYNTVPGQYAALLYVNCQVVDAALKAAAADSSDKEKFMAALKAVSLTDTRAARSSSITSTTWSAISTSVASARRAPSTG